MAFARLLEKKTHLIPGNMLSCFVCFILGEQHWLKRPLDTGVKLPFLCEIISFSPTGLYTAIVLPVLSLGFASLSALSNILPYKHSRQHEE